MSATLRVDGVVEVDEEGVAEVREVVEKEEEREEENDRLSGIFFVKIRKKFKV